jgi:NAD(P)H-nitrite reductase large subunit
MSLSKIPLLNKRIRFPVTPHLPGGLVTPEILKKIAAVAEEYNASLKITGNSITLIGLNLVDGEKALAAIGCGAESFIAKTVRSVAFCPGKPDCPRAQQDSTQLGLELDKEFFGEEVPAKIRIGVSGCANCCAEVFVKDIGLYGTPKGYRLIVGGNSGLNAQIGKVIVEDLPPAKAKEAVGAILAFYRLHGKTKERLSQTIERIGWEAFSNEIHSSLAIPRS